MIFPELPRRQQYEQQQVHSTADSIKTPLRSVEDTAGSSRITVEEWWIKHGLATDPAAALSRNYKEDPIDWLARDAIEFYALCTSMIVWIAYWLGIHRGWW
jgi:hypothetical protein